LSAAPTRFDDYRAWKSWDAEGFARVDTVQARYFEAEFAACGLALRPGLKLLEIGFGAASLAAWAKARDWRYSGTELDPELVLRARAMGFDAHEAGASLAAIAPEDPFDLIVAFDVLEHLTLDQIGDLLAQSRGRLGPAGLFVARFPSGDSPFSRAIQNGDVTHQTTIGSGMVEQLALAGGFEVMQIRGPVFPLTGMGLKRLVRRLPVAMARALIGSILRLAYFDNDPHRVLEPNMVVVLRPAAGAA